MNELYGLISKAFSVMLIYLLTFVNLLQIIKKENLVTSFKII